ncbi:MAG: hypothetical protein J5I98_25085 [Phaeodactylibacter sp.]|nr:hypothetical protein [Phaeodactylibacter sp.]
MKKFVFYLSLVLSALLAMNIVQILATRPAPLTEYSLGYLAGQAILLLLFVALAILYWRKMKTPREDGIRS